MYEDEYVKIDNTTNTTNTANAYATAPAQKNKKQGKGKIVGGAIALLLAGVLAGGGITYGLIGSKENAKPSTQATTETTESAVTEEDTQEFPEANSVIEDVAPENEIVQEKTEQNETIISENTELKTTGSDTSMSVSDIVKECLSSVVAITNTGENEVRSMWGTYIQQSQSAGSGIIVGQTENELLILTNYHVVEGSNQLSVVFSWEEGEAAMDDADIIEAVIKDYDAGRDIAVIAIDMSELSKETIENITVATIGSSDDLELGEQVVAIGNALGYGQSVTTGIVSALNRTMTAGGQNYTETTTGTYIQTDAAINPGNSGGALFNMKGELVGVNSAKIGGSSVEGMGYAIPISDIREDVESMMNTETRGEVDESERGFLGVNFVDVTSDISSTYGIPEGVYISNVNPGSAAEKAGLEKENIITAINGRSIASGADLKKYLAHYAVGETVTVTIAEMGDNGYEYRDVEVTLGRNTSASSNPVEESGQEPEAEYVEPDDTNGVNNFNQYEFFFDFPFGSFGFGD